MTDSEKLQEILVMLKARFWIMPTEVAQLAKLQADGVLSKQGVNKVVRMIWQARKASFEQVDWGAILA